MVDSHIVLARIDKIRECIAKLRTLQTVPQETFLNDASITDRAERNLQIAIQAIIDIGNHVVADLDLGTPKDYKDIFQLLTKSNIVSAPLGAKLASMTGLRNILVHDYLEIDLKLIYRIIQDDLSDLDEFISAALKLI